MKVKFIGPWPEANVDGIGHVERGKTYDVPASLAASLSPRSFKKAAAPKPRAAKKTAAKKTTAPKPEEA